MRQHLIALALVTATTASADRTADALHPKPIDIKPVIDRLAVYRDETGMYFVAPRGGNPADDDSEYVFWGDAKTMYRQRIVGYRHVDSEYDWHVWSPRVRGLQSAKISLKAGKMTIECRTHDPGKALVELPDDQAKAILAHATFMPPLWTRQSHTLARDDAGVYYYVDELREEFGGHGQRVFVGQKGAMKELPMTSVVSDSAGEIFATRSGELDIVANEDGKAYWKKGTTKLALIKLELLENRYVIYRELGVYGSLGVVCDDR